MLPIKCVRCNYLNPSFTLNCVRCKTQIDHWERKTNIGLKGLGILLAVIGFFSLGVFLFLGFLILKG
jgi:uncharacterized paraquat-inducible protein A